MPRPFLAGYDDFREFVNPLIAARAELLGEPYRLQAVDGDQLVDVDGQRVFDLLAGWGTQAFGHRHPRIEAALRAFLDSRSPAFFTSSVSPYAGLLARELCARSGGAYANAWFGSSGGEAVDAALKLARAATGRPRLLSLEGAYHGCTLGGTSLVARGPYAEPFGPPLAGTGRLPPGDLAALERELQAGDVAAVLVEPVQVEAGVRPLDAAYVEALGALTQRHGTLLVADEIQTGLGRTGRFLATGTWPRRPDVVVLGKALGGGLLPLSAVLTAPGLFARAYGTFPRAEAHTSTWSGSALPSVAALALLELLDDQALAQARASGERLRTELRSALGGSPLFREVRGEGLLVGLELSQGDQQWLTFDGLGLSELADRPAVGMLLGHRLFRAGWLTSVCGHDWSTLRLHPPLDVSGERLTAFVAACREAVEFLCSLR